MGIDSGTTTAYAVLDYDGQLLALKSAKNMKKSKLVAELAPYSPSLIACDTNPPVRLASWLKTCFSARLYYPKESLLLEEKHKLAKKAKTKNSHERDALAAAKKALHSVENKLRQTMARAARAGASQARAASLVLAGQKMTDAVAAEPNV